VANSQSLLFDSKPLVHAMAEKLKEDPYFLLCDNPDCGICPRRRLAR